MGKSSEYFKKWIIHEDYVVVSRIILEFYISHYDVLMQKKPYLFSTLTVFNIYLNKVFQPKFQFIESKLESK